MTFCSAGESLYSRIHASSALQRPPREQAGGDPLNRSDRAHDSASVAPRSFRVTKSPGAFEGLWNTTEPAGQSVRLILGRGGQEGRRLRCCAPRVLRLGYCAPRVLRTSGTAHSDWAHRVLGTTYRANRAANLRHYSRPLKL